MNERKDRIDLNNLSERELLILLAKDQERIKDQCDEMDHKLQDLSLKVNTLETKSKFWGAVAGFVTAVFVALIEKLFK
jgi:hypothetical protein